MEKSFKKETNNQDGYILIVGVIFIAFIFVLLSSAASLININLKQTSHEIWKEKSRQNALLSLNLAIAKVQKFAGSDFAVSRNYMKPNSEKYRWLELWSDSSKNPIWLVPDKNISNNMEIFLNTERETVKIPTFIISKTETDQSTGSYWISGENEKAPISRRNVSSYDSVLFENDYGCNPPLILNTTGLHAFIPQLKTNQKSIQIKTSKLISNTQIKNLQPNLVTDYFYSIAMHPIFCNSLVLFQMSPVFN